DYAEEMKSWRRWIHQNPELQFDCHKTAEFVVARLREFGITEIHKGIATSGVVAIIDGQGDGPTLGLRADMDALPITEGTGAAHSSSVPGKMHACGHDGHTTMLLGAAKYLAETRNFSGRVALIFQPAEEAGGGGGVMVEEGIMDRFDIAEVYALHNAPNTPAGHFYTDPGPIMAAVDEFMITVTGAGGHAAYPHDAVDPIPAAVSLVQAFQTIVSRNHKPTRDLVVSVTQIHTGTAHNIIPASTFVGGTVRSLAPEDRDMVERRMGEIVAGHEAAFRVQIDFDYQRDYPATINHPEQTAFAVEVAREIAGEAAVDPQSGPEMGAEDFAYMLEARPGAYLFIGQGETEVCHHPGYDFNDEIAPVGASFFARLVERAQPPR
ncbi:MAG: amidohydrolase, partial [Litoreibacter sp.]|nr:amidohydrolase [Litoreibacter sp.]